MGLSLRSRHQCHRRACIEPQGARIEITDNDPGIPGDERDAVLRRFYRSESGRRITTPGYGLRLSIVAAIVRLHGFRLQITESESGGARVSVECWARHWRCRLPRVDQRPIAGCDRLPIGAAGGSVRPSRAVSAHD